MSKVIDLRAISRELKGGGGPPDNGGMDARLTDLDLRLTRIEAKLDASASKADISDVRTDIQKSAGETHKWMIATIIGLFLGFGSLFMGMANFLKPTTPPGGGAPIILYPTPAGPMALPPPPQPQQPAQSK